MSKKTCFPYVLGVRLSKADANWVSLRAQSLRLTNSSLARILIGIGIETVQKNPSLILSGGADCD